MSANRFHKPIHRATIRDIVITFLFYVLMAVLFFLGFWLTSADVDDELIRPDSSTAAPTSGQPR